MLITAMLSNKNRTVYYIYIYDEMVIRRLLIKRNMSVIVIAFTIIAMESAKPNQTFT